MIDDGELGEVMVTEDDIRRRVAELGAEITAHFAGGQPPLMVAVLKGAFVFLADLVRAVEVPLEVDFMAISSYGNATRSSGVVRIVKDLDIDLEGRDVVLVEDIVDSGLTLSYLQKLLLARHPASLSVCALLVREGAELDEAVRWVGFRLPKVWVVGYGLDGAQRWRNLPDIRRYEGTGGGLG